MARAQLSVRARLLIPVAFDLRDPDRSGIARVARSVARAFTNNAQGRFEVTLCGPARTLRALGAESWGPVRIVDWDAGRLSLRADARWDRVRRAVGAAVWYFPHWDAPLHAFPDRSIVTVHDLTALRVPGATTPFRRQLSRFWIRRSARAAARIVCGSDFSKCEIGSEWPDLADKIRVITHGVEPRFFAEPAPPTARIAAMMDKGPFMLSVGNKKPHKNLAMGVEVLRRVPTARWIVVGEQFRGWNTVADRIRDAGVEDRVDVIDPVPDDVLHALYRGAKCLFFPSRHEGFGLPILEALASETRVVIGSAGASVEVLAGHGDVCGPDDPDCFAAAVSRAFNAMTPPDPAARDHARSFTWDAAARSLAGIAEEIASERLA